MWVQPRTLTGYLIAMVIVFAILNALDGLSALPYLPPNRHRDRFRHLERSGMAYRRSIIP